VSRQNKQSRTILNTVIKRSKVRYKKTHNQTINGSGSKDISIT